MTSLRPDVLRRMVADRGGDVMATEWMHRKDAPHPSQLWVPFPCDAIVQIRNAFGESNIGPAGDFWWGYATELGEISEGVIVAARRLDKPKRMNHDH